MAEFVWELPAIAPEAAASSPVAVGDGAIDHAQAAVDRLIQWFKKPQNKAFIRALCKPMAALEQAFLDIIAQRNLDNASGEALNIIGRLVGQPKVDVAEATYKSLVRARIPANKSNGIGDEILLITRLVLSDYDKLDKDGEHDQLRIQAINNGHASFVIRIHDLDVPWDLAVLLQRSFLEKVAGTGIYASLSFTAQRAAGIYLDYQNTFSFRDRVSGTGGVGFGDSVSGGVGGVYSSRLGRSIS